MKLSEAHSKKSKTALILSVTCLLIISSISVVNVSYGAAGSQGENKLLAEHSPMLHNYNGWTTSSQPGTPGVGCIEPLTSGKIGAYYSEPYCYGHDEASLGFVSSEPGSGGNAVLNFSLPASKVGYPQADFYGAIWFGGVAYDPKSLDNQAFMEFQFYPATPQYLGPGSGSKDCNSQGFFYENTTLGLNSNQWFACMFVFAVNATSHHEDVVFSAPLDSPGYLDVPMVMNGNDLLSVHLSGEAQSSTQPWQISLKDYTSSQQAATFSLQNGTQDFSPYYNVSSAYDGLDWGTAQSPPLLFAFEIGHSLSTDCNSANFTDGGIGGLPGDGSCDSYEPGLWARSGLIHIYAPLMGTIPSLPRQISFDSSQGGVSEIYNSSLPLSRCKAPSFSPSSNCIYPFYVYEYNTSSFIFLSSLVSGNVNDYENTFEFPGTTNETNGQFMENVQPAPSSEITTVTSFSLSTLTTTAVSTFTSSPTEQAFSLTVETKSSAGSAVQGQTVTLSNSTGFSVQGKTDGNGRLVFTGLSQGSTYTATSNIDGSNLSATITFGGNSIILLEPSPPSQTNPISQAWAYLLVAISIVVIAIGSLLVIRRRRYVRPSFGVV